MLMFDVICSNYRIFSNLNINNLVRFIRIYESLKITLPPYFLYLSRILIKGFDIKEELKEMIWNQFYNLFENSRRIASDVVYSRLCLNGYFIFG